MKTFYLCMIPVFLFFGAVYGVSKSVKFKPWTKPGQEQEYKEFRTIVSMPVVDAKSEKKPKVLCPTTEFDFGTMPPFADGTHSFKITNSGEFPLALRNAGASCSCLSLKFAAALVEPGETKELQVSWNTDKAGKLAQYVKISTNSPETPELQLWVTGEVKTIIDASVPGFGFDSLLRGETRTQAFWLYSGLWDKINVERIETSSPDVLCERLEEPPSVETAKRITTKHEQPNLVRSRVDFRMTVKAQSTGGERVETIRLFIRPPHTSDQAVADASSSPLSLAALYNSLRPDGTLMIELPVTTRVVRRLSLYGPAIADAERKVIDLGKLRTNSPQRDWTIIAKIRGDQAPRELNVTLTGIDGLNAYVEKIPGDAQVGTSFRIRIHAREKLSLGVHNGPQAGRLVIEAPGLEGEEQIEFMVELDVLEE